MISFYKIFKIYCPGWCLLLLKKEKLKVRKNIFKSSYKNLTVWLTVIVVNAWPGIVRIAWSTFDQSSLIVKITFAPESLSCLAISSIGKNNFVSDWNAFQENNQNLPGVYNGLAVVVFSPAWAAPNMIIGYSGIFGSIMAIVSFCLRVANLCKEFANALLFLYICKYE